MSNQATPIDAEELARLREELLQCRSKLAIAAENSAGDDELIAQLRLNDERYRWLRSYDRVHAEDDPWVVCWADPEHTSNGHIPLSEDELDAAIDAARQQPREKS